MRKFLILVTLLSSSCKEHFSVNDSAVAVSVATVYTLRNYYPQLPDDLARYNGGGNIGLSPQSGPGGAATPVEESVPPPIKHNLSDFSGNLIDLFNTGRRNRIVLFTDTVTCPPCITWEKSDTPEILSQGWEISESFNADIQVIDVSKHPRLDVLKSPYTRATPTFFVFIPEKNMFMKMEGRNNFTQLNSFRKQYTNFGDTDARNAF